MSKSHIRIRILSVLLTFAMLFSLLPANVLAADGETDNEIILDIANGSVILENGTYTQGSNEAQELSGKLVITGSSDANTIIVNPGADNTATFTIRDLTLSTASGASLIDVQSGEAALTLEGENTLTGGGTGFLSGALIRVSGEQALTIDGDGALNLLNGAENTAAHGAAIGGSAAEDGGTICIAGGTINIQQYGPAAGIGGGGPIEKGSATGDSGDITITGGSITVSVTAANNYGGGCGIGPGMNYYTTPSNSADGILNSITISGGTVNVTTASIKSGSSSYYSGPAIGTGRVGASGDQESKIHITGTANVTVSADVSAAIGAAATPVTSSTIGGGGVIHIDGDATVNAHTVYVEGLGNIYAGAAIGQGFNCFVDWDITVDGNASVQAHGDVTGAGIGGSMSYSDAVKLNIHIGGSAVVVASGSDYAAGIGAGYSLYTPASRTTISIGDQAQVTASGGYYGAGIGTGNGAYSPDSGDITISGSASIIAIGGPEASAIGAGSEGKVAGTTTITEGTTIIAYADGDKFAIDMDTTGSGAVNVTDTVLNGRFAEDEDPPTDADDDPSPINLLKDGNSDADLTLPDDYRSFAVTASDGSGTIRVQDGESLNRYAYYTDTDGNKQINYPVYENTDGSGGYLMLTKDDLRWMPTVELKPADITIYMGGSGYDGVVDENGDIQESMENGLPNAGFYVTLPEDLSSELKAALGVDEDDALDLSPYLTFRSGTKTWTLEPYDGKATSTVTGADGIQRYIYRLVAGIGQDAVRMQFTDAEGSVHVSDSFKLTDALYSEYDMSIYPGAVDQTTVYAEINTAKVTEDGGDPSKISYTTYAASAASGTLTIRGVTQEGGTTEVKPEVTEAVEEITAVLPTDTTYTINDSGVQVVSGTPSLLVDSIVHSEESDQLLTEKALSTLHLEASDNLRYDFRYLDLVDASNGNTWIKADNDVTVYWPYPTGTSQSTTFYLVHFDGLDREMTVADIADRIDACNAVEVEVTNTGYGISFTTSSFSPFVLIWTASSGGGGGGGTTYYTLTYESNGGTTYEKERYASGTTVQLTKSPVREGYTFTGWYADKELTDAISSIKMTSNKTVYAGWEATDTPGWLNGDDHFAYVIGYDDGTVRPLDNITRSEVAAIFFRLLRDEVREEYLTESNTFADVTDGMWHNTAISTLAAMGILEGRSETCFDPNAPITRAEFAAICARFSTEDNVSGTSFTDIKGHWAEKEIQEAASLGWILGRDDGTFGPDLPITRAEAMTMINRVLCRLPETEDDLLDDMIVWPDNQPDTWYYLAVQEATNSHDFQRKDDVHERWTALRQSIDWTQYQ
ncbi:S-layer homology domain-containing protein [Flavonifractor sp. HCP28S3_F3]|uniref:S-layer homology domain-containing protein n=1 Tax=Flavonifractor sp. HCP28S3_F3 TaxID=3438939 RepID=UPI003F8BB468